ncbi:unnamed protein product [Aphanomyces euteiches]|uniref:Uncharacterized protein n=1 Tax=Aphanomyces euteiches TaxID=100861 RepID=A0A6G0WCB2_9STRA|nr:hypothetical protein Ae201684_016943 [Aphanomyces euteiches]KAH9073772.1 hypothetical protein Ae201684P_003275 [Aphanomyces euteiches]KAH9154487.1 hypothetical protein AeRB84_003424 [Aphanomyces euteiches]
MFTETNNILRRLNAPTASKDSKAKQQPMWLRVFQSSRAKLRPSSKPAILACCEKRKQVEAFVQPVSDEPLVTYKVVNWGCLRQHKAIVGGKPVPFYPNHNIYHRAMRKVGTVLDTIPEDNAANICDVCHAHTLNAIVPCVSITLR